MSRRRRNRVPSAPPRVGDHPIVAVLGRPNVGKSTLFNRIVGRQVSIVEDRPGVTRDRLYAEADIGDKRCTLVDMGGFEFDPDGAIETGINRQCRVALEQAALVLFVVDGRVPPTSGDKATADLLRRTGRPSILVVNKVDGARQEVEATDAFSLGIEPVVMVSALHGRGVADLEDLIYARLPESARAFEDDGADDADGDGEGDAGDAPVGPVKVAIIGRPNAGKSSLINTILGEARLLTLDEPGTTRDAIDSVLERGDKSYVLVDTAGIRRKSRVPLAGPEKLAVTSAVRAIERCHVVVLLLDAGEGVAEQDAKVLGLAVDRGRAAVVALNKWDLVKGDAARQRKLVESARDVLTFAPWVKTTQICALTGAGVDKLFDLVDATYAEFTKRVPTGELNRLFEDIVEHHPPPLRKGRPVRLYYATQASVRPPTFVVQCSYPEVLHFSYQRYVQNRIRETFGFEGTPIRIHFRQRQRKG
jgi:GTP-binding protein